MCGEKKKKQKKQVNHHFNKMGWGTVKCQNQLPSPTCKIFQWINMLEKWLIIRLVFFAYNLIL